MRIAVITCLVCLALTSPCLALASLSDADIADAIRYGQQNANFSIPQFTQPWTFIPPGTTALGNRLGSITVKTPYLNVAMAARTEANNFSDLSKTRAREIAAKSAVSLAVSTRGDNMVFLTDYRLAFKQGDKLITPTATSFDALVDKSKFYPKSPRYEGRLYAELPINQLDAHAPLLIQITDTRADQTAEVMIDLAKVK